MSQHYKDIKIDEEAYVIEQFLGKKSLKVFSRLLKFMGVPMSKALNGMDKDFELVVPEMMAALVERLDEDEVEGIVGDLLSCVTQRNVQVWSDFDMRFQGRLGHVFKLLVEVVKYQYSDFFAVLASAKLKREVPRKLKSQNTLSG